MTSSLRASRARWSLVDASGPAIGPSKDLAAIPALAIGSTTGKLCRVLQCAGITLVAMRSIHRATLTPAARPFLICCPTSSAREAGARGREKQRALMPPPSTPNSRHMRILAAFWKTRPPRLRGASVIPNPSRSEQPAHAATPLSSRTLHRAPRSAEPLLSKDSAAQAAHSSAASGTATPRAQRAGGTAVPTDPSGDPVRRCRQCARNRPSLARAGLRWFASR